MSETFNNHDVYPMPMFATLEQPDLEAAIAWYQSALGFSAVFVAPNLAHLRRGRYQDILLVQGAGRASIGIRADGDPAELARQARAAAVLGASAIDGPIDTPWNSTDVRIVDPAGHRLVLTAPRTVPDPELAARTRAWLEQGRKG